jgi:CheY-like chemotaxis protein/signal transduction histidine kinase
MAHGRDNFLMRNATAVAIASVTLLIALAGVVIDRQAEERNATKEWLMHTHEVTEHIQMLFGQLKDAELGQRGYIISGDDDYLLPYRNALTNAPQGEVQSTWLVQHHSVLEELSILRELVKDNPTQQRNLSDAAASINELLAYWAVSIDQRRHSETAALAEFDIHRGMQLMRHLRALVGSMMVEESRMLDLRTEADLASTRQSRELIFSGLGLFYIVMVASIWFYQRSRGRYTRELEHNEEQLKIQHEELQVSNEEMETTNEELEEKTSALEEQNAQIQRQSQALIESKRLIEEKASELERANTYKSEFLANMSHELRTPLNSMLILAKLHASNDGGNLTEEQIEEARVIHSGGLELLGLINDILDLSKVEAGKLMVNAEETALEGIVNRVRQQFVPIARQAGIDFPVLMTQPLPETLYIDAQRVEQILKNLLANAFKFTERGSVTLEVRLSGAAEHAGWLAFVVTDTGIGIEASKFKDIFEAFQQEDGSIDRHYGGTGLGLTIARKFAHMLGGEIHVESEKGKGSIFTLALPMVRAVFPGEQSVQVSDAPEAPRALPPEFIADDRYDLESNSKLLLIIEDDRNFAAILMKIARARGYKCICAGDGKTGLLMAMEHKVTAIILDLKLPDMDGLQVLDQLKRHLATRPIPVHIMTGRDEGGSVAPLSKGAIGYLTKPVAKEAIEGAFAKIEALLQAKVKHVLIVEDDKNSQTAIRSLLKKPDTELTVVDTGHAALMYLENTAFDCIILDLHLPDMTGFEWLEKTSQSSIALPPVIVYTATDLTEDETRDLERYTEVIIIKGAKSSERLLDEVTLFLHSVASTLSDDQQEMMRMQHDPQKLLQGRTILLADDDMRNTFALSKLLKIHGMKIVIAENGRVAVDKLKQNADIELVLMDIMMPVMDGYQAMREIRAQAAYTNIPIIALTARAMPEEQKKCMEAGANDYLTKPVDADRLLALMRVWLFKQGLERQYQHGKGA